LGRNSNIPGTFLPVLTFDRIQSTSVHTKQSRTAISPPPTIFRAYVHALGGQGGGQNSVGADSRSRSLWNHLSSGNRLKRRSLLHLSVVETSARSCTLISIPSSVPFSIFHSSECADVVNVPGGKGALTVRSSRISNRRNRCETDHAIQSTLRHDDLHCQDPVGREPK
jgi:hypothetical protein